MLDVQKMPSTKMWPSTEPLHVRFGPWIAGDWAGTVNWTAYPNPTQYMREVSVVGCMLD